MKLHLLFLFLIILSGCIPTEAIPKTFKGKVVGVKDGDTIEVLYKGKAQVIRLAEIDCPEKNQAFGQRARQFTSGFCFGKTVKVVSQSKDRYQRILGTVYVNNKNMNAALLKAGMAWHYKKYSSNDQYALLEQEARAYKRGLWADKKPVAPWEFRSKKRIKKVKKPAVAA